ncbi:MAG: hypothetical protein QNJ90_00150 [Planctomycetota bacterium]|nr:hypothetical protein [Planctomycetota bacterium]
MNTRLVGSLSFICLLLLSACGAGDSKDARARAALEELFAAARAEDYAKAAPRVVYRGRDKDRKWKDTYDAEKPEDRELLERALREVKAKVGEGTPEWLEFRSEKESEGEWLAWKVKTSQGTFWFACLEIDGRVALGDID